MIEKSKQHLEVVNKSWWEHFCFAQKISFRLLKASFVLCLHGFFPGLFQWNTSNSIEKIHNDLNGN
jgi:hypothetical protein